MTLNRRDNFALNAPPVPDWFMPAGEPFDEDKWMKTAGRSRAESNMREIVNRMVESGRTYAMVEEARKDALEQVKEDMEAARYRHEEHRAACLELREFSWRVFFADKLITELDKEPES